MSYVMIPGMRKTVVIQMDDHTFENLIKQELPKLIDVPKIDDYEFVAYEESSNDSAHSLNGLVLQDYYKTLESPFEHDIENWKNGKFHFQAVNFVSFLVYKGILEPAEYVVKVSW